MGSCNRKHLTSEMSLRRACLALLLVHVRAGNALGPRAALLQADGRKCLFGEDLWSFAKQSGVTASETAAVEEAGACVPETGVAAPYVTTSMHNGVPKGVECEQQQWCDSQGICTNVCQRGTVQIDTWYAWASGWQRKVADTLPLCYTSMLGTHNSAISMSDGYGNQDKYWEWYLQYLPSMGFPQKLYTNDQWLSLTDQLNIGARFIELDTHWVAGELRTAHCGGVHAPVINTLLRALNALSKMAGRKIHWDTETIGCNPSLSSLPVKDQRLLKEALAEVRAWLELPRNVNEFVMLFLDDEHDLRTWGKVPRLLNEIKAAFPAGWLWTPEWMSTAAPGVWPSLQGLRSLGARVMVTSRQNYGPIAWPLLFNKTVCDLWEPSISKVAPPPQCFDKHGRHPGSGQFSRVNDCRLLYGPFNCNFQPRSSADQSSLLTPSHMQQGATCGWNCLSPDWLTPELAHSSIWSWAPNEPRSLGLSTLPSPIDAALAQTNALLDAEQSVVHTATSPAVTASVLAAVHRSSKASELFTLADNVGPSTNTQRVPAGPQNDIVLKIQAQQKILRTEDSRTRSQHSVARSQQHLESHLLSHPRKVHSKGLEHAMNTTLSGHMHAVHAQEAVPACAAMSVTDGRWRSVMCNASLPAACRAVLPMDTETPSSPSGPQSSGSDRVEYSALHQRRVEADGLHHQHQGVFGDDSESADLDPHGSAVNLTPHWVLGNEVVFSMETGWRLSSGAQQNTNLPEDSGRQHHLHGSQSSNSQGARSVSLSSGVQCEGCCPPGFAFVYPQSGWDNLQLWLQLGGAGEASAMLPIIPGVIR